MVYTDNISGSLYGDCHEILAALTAILRDDFGKMHHGILFDRRLMLPSPCTRNHPILFWGKVKRVYTSGRVEEAVGGADIIECY